MRTLAAVFAHPDDETFATGGTLAKYAAAGARDAQAASNAFCMSAYARSSTSRSLSPRVNA